MDAMTWLTLVLALTAVVSAVFAFMQAKAAVGSREDAETARNESRAARDEAVLLSREANAAFTRQAEAQERANEIEISKQPKKEVRWLVQQIRGTRFTATNRGSISARSAYVVGAGGDPGLIRPEETEPRDVDIDGSIGFLAFRVMGLDPMVEMRWIDSETGDSRTASHVIRS
jgi:hypothetical protein